MVSNPGSILASAEVHSAEYQLEEILNDLKYVYEGNEFKRRIWLNLDRIRAARKNGVAFNENIVYYHLDQNLLPDAAILSEPAPACQAERRRIVRVTFGSVWAGTFRTVRVLGRGERVPRLVLLSKT